MDTSYEEDINSSSGSNILRRNSKKQVEFRHLETMEMGIPVGDSCGNKGREQEWCPVCERSIQVEERACCICWLRGKAMEISGSDNAGSEHGQSLGSHGRCQLGGATGRGDTDRGPEDTAMGTTEPGTGQSCTRGWRAPMFTHTQRKEEARQGTFHGSAENWTVF